MNLIQVILICGLALSGLAYIVFWRSATLDRFLVLCLSALGAAAVLFPLATTRIANFLGVGRGTDLIFYLYIVASLFAIILLYGRLSRLQQMLTVLVRELALREAHYPADNSK